MQLFRSILLSLCFLSAAGALAAEPASLSWRSDYASALQEGRETGKPLLLFFTGSDWCVWCKRLHQEVFQSGEFAREVGSSFVFVEIDSPMRRTLKPELQRQNERLKQQFQVKAFPSVILVDPQGFEIARTGYKAGGGRNYAAHLKSLLKQRASR